nr:VWA domain-containing protein [Yoonia ponticola]
MLICLSFIPNLATAQDRTNTILVLDGSGSMWGQIDGVNKIVIARDVVGQILADFPPDENLGLTVYGHRERGNCADIETIVAPVPNSASEILAAVNAISPRGKTPMTDAIIAAAQALRYTEVAATVILVSDGIETCNPDPCAAARALNEAGIDFTAHVVGFDVTEPDALAQMQCIADETGGQFLTASDAEELSAALSTVAAVVQPDPEPILTRIDFRATRGEGGDDVTAQVTWDISGGNSVNIAAPAAASYATELAAGNYTVRAYDAVNDIAAIADFTVTETAQTVTVVLAVPQPKATITAQDTAIAGETIAVDWTGPNADRDFISVGAVVQNGTPYINYTYTVNTTEDGLQMPPVAGTYLLRYISDDNQTELAAREITVTPLKVALIAPEAATAGETITIGWDGPDYLRDYISVGPADGTYINYTYTKDGNPLTLVMPSEPGDYEVRYVLDQAQTVVARSQITVGDVGASLTAPDTAMAGETVSVGWTGPAYDRDYISVAQPDVAGGQYENYTYVNEGTPLDLVMPSEAGTYEIRYIVAQGNVVLSRQTLTVNEVAANLTAPATAPMGASVTVAWTGPNYDLDYISVASVGDGGGQYVNYTYTKDGAPLQLIMPATAGEFEIRYIQAQDSVILYSQPVTVSQVKAQLVAEQVVPVTQGEIIVGWEGPDYSRDYIGIANAGADGYLSYAYTSSGNPVSISLPDAAGDYEIRYFMGQGGVVLGEIPLTVTANK